MTYIFLRMHRRSHPSGTRRAFAALALALCLALCTAVPAFAADSLPNPDGPAKTSQKKAQANSNLPMTGIDGRVLILAGVALMAAGVAVLPAARRRRSYRTDTWERAVRNSAF
jgi:LPXTG-motif cell wall-anchored protein